MITNVIGIGYIGLPTSLSLAANGISVVATDVNEDIIRRLSKGKVTFSENGLEKLFDKAKGNIAFETKPIATDVYIVAVPTPFDSQTKKVDMCYVKSAVEAVLGVAPNDAIIVVESTVSPGSVDSLRPLLRGNIKLAHAPERILPGNMIYELEHNSRVIGTDDTETAERLKLLYTRFCKGEIYLTDIRTAEMIKVAENTFRAVNIAYANELLKICREADIDVRQVIEIANKHPRVNIASPGPGVGGHCIPIDPWFLVGEFAKTAQLVKVSLEVNASMPQFVYDRIKEICKSEGINRIGVYGLTYKENVDDIRESPSLRLMELLAGECVAYYDPYVKQRLFKQQCFDFDTFCENSELIVIMTVHAEILERENALTEKIVFDTRNCIRPVLKLQFTVSNTANKRHTEQMFLLLVPV
ncbi:UDP-N-acetyl-D-mannosaminuronic acid dehydrogenase [Clostridia bacterium]|nr:UDP-N-acetyl-D-mannosaminuronic acid dehydrogenase [Clostridia bacterium]